MSFLRNIFSLNQDAGSWMSHLMGILSVMAASPAGQKAIGVAAATEEVSWGWAAAMAALYFLGARGGQANATKR